MARDTRLTRTDAHTQEPDPGVNHEEYDQTQRLYVLVYLTSVFQTNDLFHTSKPHFMIQMFFRIQFVSSSK